MSRLPRLNPSIPILGILLILTATLRLVNLTGSPARLDDEGTYMAQAYAVAEWGELAHYTYWYDHPPAGWLQLALWTVLSGPDFGGNAVAAGRYLMVIVAVITATTTIRYLPAATALPPKSGPEIVVHSANCSQPAGGWSYQ